MEFRIGYGEDLHRLVVERELILAGVIIESDKGTLGHSDGDVLCHAIADSILGAIADKDIGSHFPDNAKWTEGMSGLVLLEKTIEVLKRAEWSIVNIDSTIILEKPKLSPYMTRIRENLSKVLDIDISCVSVKAKTNEGLSEIGSGDAIACRAVCLLSR